MEFALVLPILLLILMGVFDFGRAIFAYNTVANAAVTGARVAAVNQILTSPTCQRDKPTTTALNPFWSIKACTIQAGSSIGLTDADVTVSYAPPAGSTLTCSPVVRVGCIASITVVNSVSMITPIISSIVGPIDLESTSTMPIERVFP